MDNGKVEEQSNELVQSFLLVRRALGWLGFFLPLSLIVAGLVLDRDIQSSISAMYHTSAGDLLVGTLIAISVFLWSYVGYSRREGEVLSDRLISRLAALGAAGVALIPVSPPLGLAAKAPPAIAGRLSQTGLTDTLHYASAILFFTCLAIFSLVLFRRTGGHAPDADKRANNLIHLIAGALIAAVTVAMLAYALWYRGRPPETQALLDQRPVLFVLETMGIFAFATSWLVKGKSLGPLRAAARMMVK
jgi:amino acid transporter